MNWPRARPSASILDDAAAAVWRVDLERPLADEGALTAEERARAERYLDDARGAVFARTRAATRAILAPLCGRPAGALRISERPGGKPRALERRAPHWNVSHSGAWALIAVGRAPLGVDLERARPRPAEELRPIARRVFDDEELRLWERAPQAQLASLFYRLWVRKESYMKWDGRGFALGPGSLFIGWEERERARCAPDSPAILDLDVDADHPAALCYERAVPERRVALLTFDPTGCAR